MTNYEELQKWPDKTSIDFKLLDNLPHVKEIRRKIPEHLFRPQLTKSLSYLLRCYGLLLCFALAMKYVAGQFAYGSWFYPVYVVVAGILLWAIFVIGHDVGHGAFSGSKKSKFPLVDEFIGQITHSFTLMIPYRGWQVSHQYHHRFNANLQKDQVKNFMNRQNSLGKILSAYPFFTGVSYYLYLLGIFGPNHYYLRKPKETDDAAAILFFQALTKHRKSVYISLFAVFLAISLQSYLIWNYGILTLFIYYYLPLFVCSTILVAVTFLQHTDEQLLWFDQGQWTYLKGALMSIDRDFGKLHGLTNHVGTHQVHHLFPQIPHYYLDEATVHFRRHFPDLYMKNSEPIFRSFFKNAYDLLRFSHWNGKDEIISIEINKKRYEERALR